MADRKPYLVNGAVEMRSLYPEARRAPDDVRDSLSKMVEVWRDVEAEDALSRTQISLGSVPAPLPPTRVRP